LQSITQVPEAYPSPVELQNAYDNAQDNLQAPALYRVKQIFLAVAAGQDEQEVHKRAVELSRRAKAPNADFAALAKQYSQDRTSAEQGGDSGLLPLQQYVPQLRQVIVAQQIGNVSEPLRSNAGFHIIQLSEVQPSRRATLDEVRDALRQTLRNQRQEQIAKAYMEGLLNAATLSIDGPQLSQALEAQPAP
jgi:peptidylprolyl isomerase